MKNKKLIVFIDSGDTIIDEATQIRDDKGIVQKADFIPGAGEVLKTLHDEGFTVALVADGEWDSFQNVYRNNGLGYCFDAWIVSEVVGKQKPEPVMFEAAYEALKLTEADKPRIVMIGNNVERDIAGANRFGIRSVLETWSPRYRMTPANAEETPTYTVRTLDELPDLIAAIERE